MPISMKSQSLILRYELGRHELVDFTCPALPIQRLPWARRALVEMAYSDESYYHVVGAYLASLHAARPCLALLPTAKQLPMPPRTLAHCL